MMVLKVVEYVMDPSSKCIGTVPEGVIVKQFSGKKAIEKADAWRDKLTKKAPKGKAYYVKGECSV